MADLNPEDVYNNFVAGAQAWADQQNAAAIAHYQAAWPAYVDAVNLSLSRGGLGMPPKLLPALKVYVNAYSFTDFQNNKQIGLVYGKNDIDYVCPLNTLPTPPVQTGGIGNRGPSNSATPSLWFDALPGDTVPAGTVIVGTSKDGVSGSFMKYMTPWGGLYYKVA